MDKWKEMASALCGRMSESFVGEEKMQALNEKERERGGGRVLNEKYLLCHHIFCSCNISCPTQKGKKVKGMVN